MKRSKTYSLHPAPGSGSLLKTPPTTEHLKRLDIVTLFPAMFDGPLSESLLGRARERKLISVFVHNLRDFSTDKHRKVDDRPYGGGPGMVIQAEPIFAALASVRRSGSRFFKKKVKPYVIYLSPQGQVISQKLAQGLSRRPWIVLLCGHYEGIDERALALVDQEVSIGDYVLTGGEIPAMVLGDVVARLVPGVVKEEASLAEESFQDGRLDYPHYTRPRVWKGKRVPDVLLSGDHQAIGTWRRQQAERATKKKRPDLLKGRLRRTS